MPFRFRQWVGSLFSPISFATDENGLYEAFRLRRKEHGKGRGWAMGLKLGGHAGGTGFLASGMTTTIGSILIVIFLLVLIPRYSLAIVPVVVAFVVLLVFLRQRIGGEKAVVPRTLSHLLLHAKPQRQAMLDIWMTGAGGWEVAWAVYRESRPAEWKATAAVLTILYGSMISIYFAFTQSSFLPAATISISGLLLVLSCAAVLNSGTGLAGMKAVLRKWNQDLEGPATQAVKGVIMIPAVGILFFAGIYFLGVTGALLTVLWKNAPEGLRSFPREYIASVLVWGAIILLWIARGLVDEWNSARCSNTAVAIENIYDRYIQQFVMGDTDGC